MLSSSSQPNGSLSVGITHAEPLSMNSSADSENMDPVTPMISFTGSEQTTSSDTTIGETLPEELRRRLNHPRHSPQPSIVTSNDPRMTHSDLTLSGNVISANFCLPYEIKYSCDGEWHLEQRRGTSALFDSFAYLASGQAPWKHTLVAWTGEIERPLDSSGGLLNHTQHSSASAPIPVDGQPRLNGHSDCTDMHIPVEDRARLAETLQHEHGGNVAPVWLADSIDQQESITLRQQERWRVYGESEVYPLFHYRQKSPSSGSVKTAWKDYERMNAAFADTIMTVYKPGDIVIVHDYQLLLLPQMLRQRIPNIYVGFFLHIPFPTSELYLTLTKRKQLLQGVLGANMIAFQNTSYSKHFASSCGRVLGYDFAPNGARVDLPDRHVDIDAFPIGINAYRTLQDSQAPEVENQVDALREVFLDKKIIVGRDRADSVHGVFQKLQAFEMFLEHYPAWRKKVVLVQITSPTSIAAVDEKGDKAQDKIFDLVARINGKYGDLGFAPVKYHPQYVPKEEYFALLQIADLGLITSARDGMNTTALEYVVCQGYRKSPLVISEFSGTSQLLRNGDAMHVNPWDRRGVADAINAALNMSATHKGRRHHGLFKSVMENTVQDWITRYIKRFLTNLTISGNPMATPALDCAELTDRYRNSTKRLFLFDYDGTLTPIVQDPKAAVPTERITKTIAALASDPHNAVWIISGRDQRFLDEFMGHIPALGLSAEHGSFIRPPLSTDWDNLTEKLDMTWQDPVMKVFEGYTQATPGSFIERKRIALTWHYRRADQTIGRIQAAKCQRELESQITRKWDVDVMEGKANLEVRPRVINKGEIAKRLVKAYGDVAPDFILCLGDDFTDEDMFRSLRSAKLRQDHVFAVTIGAPTKQTIARWHLPEPADVISAISNLVGDTGLGGPGSPQRL